MRQSDFVLVFKHPLPPSSSPSSFSFSYTFSFSFTSFFFLSSSSSSSPSSCCSFVLIILILIAERAGEVDASGRRLLRVVSDSGGEWREGGVGGEVRDALQIALTERIPLLP